MKNIYFLLLSYLFLSPVHSEELPSKKDTFEFIKKKVSYTYEGTNGLEMKYAISESNDLCTLRIEIKTYKPKPYRNR